jgi:DNA processing protein
MTDSRNYPIATRLLALIHFCGMTPRMFDVLLRRFGTVEALFEVDRDTYLGVDGLTESQIDHLVKANDQLEPAARLAQQLAERDIRLLTQFDPEYGQLLLELNDPPPLLYVRGLFPDRDVKTAAVVGTHRAGTEGIALTSTLVKALVGKGVQVVSTLKGGIDVAAHLAAVSNKGRSFAVLDCGIDRVATKEKMPVAIDVARQGGVISEYHPELKAGDDSLRQANRLVVGLSQAVIVTEMYSNSRRTLDMVKACCEVGKLLFFFIDPNLGALADDTALARAIECGAIPLDGLDKIDDIVRSLL